MHAFKRRAFSKGRIVEEDRDVKMVGITTLNVKFHKPPFLPTTHRQQKAFGTCKEKPRLTAMLGSAVSGLSIMVLSCHHPAWSCSGHSPTHAAQKPSEERRDRHQRAAWGADKGGLVAVDKTKQAALENEWMRLWPRWNSPTRCSSAKKMPGICSTPAKRSV